MATVEDVQFCGIFSNGDAIAGLLHHDSLTLTSQSGIRFRRQKKFFLSVDDGRGKGVHLLLDC